MEIAVVGAGVIGLSAALHLTERFPNVKVTVLADKLTPHTASDKSSASIKPADFYKGPQDNSSPEDIAAYRSKVERWFRATMEKLHTIHRSKENSKIQLSLLTHYHLQYGNTPDPWWKDLVFGFRHIKEKERRLFNLPPECSTVWSYIAYTLSPSLYLQWLQAQVISNGGVVTQTKVSSLQELDYDIVINCTGVYASSLVPDSVAPARGQSVLVKAPWVQYGIHYDCGPDLTYIIPRCDGVVLGGTLQNGDWNESVIEDTSTAIIERCSKIVPSLRGAEVVGSWAGLRPLRDRVRLEQEQSAAGLFVHCYGHGGQGISLSWGCAVDIGDIVSSRLRL